MPRVAPENSVLPPPPQPPASRGRPPDASAQPFSALLDDAGRGQEAAAPERSNASDRRDASDRTQAAPAKHNDKPAAKPEASKLQRADAGKSAKGKPGKDTKDAKKADDANAPADPATVPATSDAADNSVTADTAAILTNSAIDTKAAAPDPTLQPADQPQQPITGPVIAAVATALTTVPTAPQSPAPASPDTGKVASVTAAAGVEGVVSADAAATAPATALDAAAAKAADAQTKPEAVQPQATAEKFVVPAEDDSADTAPNAKAVDPTAQPANTAAGEKPSTKSAKTDIKPDDAGDQALADAATKPDRAEHRPELQAPSDANDTHRGNVDPTAPLNQAPAARAADVPAPASPQQNIVNTTATVAPVPIAGLAVEIAARAQSGKNRFEIRLDPPELGRIDVRLDVDRHGNVTSHLVVDRSETLDLLRRDAPNLERAFQDAGLKTSDNGMQFSLRDQSFSQRGQDSQQTPAMARLIVAEEQLSAADTMQRTYGRLAGLRGGVDIRV